MICLLSWRPQFRRRTALLQFAYPVVFIAEAQFALTHAVGHGILTATVSPRRDRDRVVIKFRCLNCGQKLAVVEDGIGAVVSCTNCADRIVVPPYSVTEFFSAEPTRLASSPVAGGPAPKRSIDSGVELIRPAPAAARAEGGPMTLRMALIPHLARMMMNRLVQALFAQRETLIDTQAEATKRMADLEERIARAQVTVQDRFAAYENRIGELEKQLLAVEDEKRELMRQNFQLARKALEAENAAAQPRPESSRDFGATRVNLRDAGFLLRA
jgi:DNA-directed RNA polymerase subunit RPC12/RpoP